jgi:UrcA family protein
MRSTIHAATIRGLGVAMICSAALLTFNPAFAAVDDSDVPRVTVRFGDLDLSKPQGAETLYRRIRAAAEQVCAPLDDRDLARHMRFNACVQNAISTAVANVDRAALTAYYEAKTNGRNATVQIAHK